MTKAPAANFVKTNQHQRKNDCIFCAMANALPVTYDEAREILARSACCVKAEIQRLRNIKKALCEMGLNVTKLETRVQFAKFAAEHADPNTNYIVIACDHAAAVVNGKLLDEWDSSRKFVQYVFEITKEAYNQIKAEYRKEEETTMKTTATTNQPTTVETTATAAIVPEVLPPEQEQPTAQEQPTTCAALIPAPLQEAKPSTALVDVDADTVALLREQAKMIAALPGVKALELVGRWLWAEFTDKPSEEIREQLKANKWSWAPKKGKWSYHNPKEARPGKHRFMTLDEIKDKYGTAAII